MPPQMLESGSGTSEFQYSTSRVRSNELLRIREHREKPTPRGGSPVITAHLESGQICWRRGDKRKPKRHNGGALFDPQIQRFQPVCLRYALLVQPNSTEANIMTFRSKHT